MTVYSLTYRRYLGNDPMIALAAALEHLQFEQAAKNVMEARGIHPVHANGAVKFSRYKDADLTDSYVATCFTVQEPDILYEISDHIKALHGWDTDDVEEDDS